MTKEPENTPPIIRSPMDLDDIPSTSLFNNTLFFKKPPKLMYENENNNHSKTIIVQERILSFILHLIIKIPTTS